MVIAGDPPAVSFPDMCPADYTGKARNGPSADGGRVVLALDAHGGDGGPGVTVAAARDAIAREPGLEIVVTGLPGEVEPLLDGTGAIDFEPAESVLESAARPVAALRQGDRSSLGRAMSLVSTGRADACVSAGNTAALMALGARMLGMLQGIRRPALMSKIPSTHGFTNMLDLGANLHVDAVQLVQFAIMGAVTRGGLDGAEPGVGLLNVGHEDSKGHTVVREAHERLRALPLDYRGFIEGNDIFAGRVDVAVCDGFSGNLVLKSSEGLARMLFGELRSVLDSGLRSRLGAWLAEPALRGMLERFDPAKHNGAPLLGLRGVVVKSHGGADRPAMVQAILEAAQEARNHVPELIERSIHKYNAEAET